MNQSLQKERIELERRRKGLKDDLAKAEKKGEQIDSGLIQMGKNVLAFFQRTEERKKVSDWKKEKNELQSQYEANEDRKTELKESLSVMDQEIVQLDYQIRKIKRDQIDEKIRDVLIQLQKTQIEQLPRLKQLTLFLMGSDRLISQSVRFVPQRIDEVKVQVLDPSWRLLFLSPSESARYVPVQNPMTGKESLPEKSLSELPDEPKRFQSLPYQMAVRYEQEGKVRILEKQDHEPVFEDVTVIDSESDMVAQLRNVNLGTPIQINSEMTDMFKAIYEKLSYFILNPQALESLIDQKEVDDFLASLDGEK
jgi:hypothetical protein